MLPLKVLALLLLLSLYDAYAANVDTLLVKSKVMDKYIKNLVVLPDDYNADAKAYPVVYLLHGAGGNHLDWITSVQNITNYADAFNFIIVCPNGGKTSWYFDSPVDKNSQYETYIAKELVQAVDATYNTIQRFNGRAITGLSMGGHGAFYMAFRHPNIWGAAGSMSGGLDLCPFPNNWNIYKRLGIYDKNKSRWEDHSVINMVYLLEETDLKIIFDCGKSDFFYKANKQFETKLKQCNIEHQFIERPGGHTWTYWANSIQIHAHFFSDFFKTSQVKLKEAKTE